MAKRRLIWQLFACFVLVTLTALVPVTLYSTYSFRRFYREQTRRELHTLAQTAAEHISTILSTSEFSRIDQICKELG